MSLEEAKRRFVEEVKLRAIDDQYIDKGEERQILQSALQQGITVDSARAALAQACEAQGYVLESRALTQLKDYLDTAAGNDGQIDEKEYHDGLTLCKKWTQGKRSDVQCKRMIVEIIQDNAYKTSRGWFGSWFDNLKKEVGMG